MRSNAVRAAHKSQSIAITLMSLVLAGSVTRGAALASQTPSVRSGEGDSRSQKASEPIQTSRPTDERGVNTVHAPQPPADTTIERIGITPGEVRNLTLRETIVLALQKDLDIEIARDNVLMSQYNLFAARGPYDRTSTLDFNYSSQASPVVSIFAGGNQNSAIAQHEVTFNLVTSQQLERGGGTLQLSFDNSRITTTSTVDTLTTQYNPSLTLTFIQPLMRNLSIDSNRRAIRIAKNQLDLSDSAFRQQVIDIINAVQHSYWDLYYAVRSERIARDALNLAHVQLENNKAMVELGAIAEAEVRSTQVTIESRKGDVLLTVQNITLAENTLKSLITGDAQDSLWKAQINPTDSPDYSVPELSLGEATAVAMKNRPEIEQSRLSAAQNQVDLAYFKNQLKPELNFVGIFGDAGFSGTPSNIPELAADVPSVFKGGYFQSVKSLFGQHFRTVQFGIHVTLPWRNRTAEGNLGNAMAQAKQIDARQRQLAQSIQVQVRNALQVLATSRQRLEAAKAARAAAESQLSDETERFLAGLVTNFFVLQRQADLASAQGTEVRALTDYNKALADVQRATGLTLISNNIEVPVSQAAPTGEPGGLPIVRETHASRPSVTVH